MNKYYFTFGSNHLDKNGNSLGMTHVIIKAENEGIARDQMHVARGPKYCTSYPENLANECVLKYGTIERSLEDVTINTSDQSSPESV